MPNKQERQASIDAFHAVTQLRDSGALAVPEWQIYEALWHNGPLNRKGLQEVLASYYAAPASSARAYSGALRKLVAGGLVSETKGKFDTTDARLRIVPPPAVKRPGKKKFAKGVEDLELALIRAERIGFATPEAQLVLEWVKSKVT